MSALAHPNNSAFVNDVSALALTNFLTEYVQPQTQPLTPPRPQDMQTHSITVDPNTHTNESNPFAFDFIDGLNLFGTQEENGMGNLDTMSISSHSSDESIISIPPLSPLQDNISDPPLPVLPRSTVTRTAKLYRRKSRSMHTDHKQNNTANKTIVKSEFVKRSKKRKLKRAVGTFTKVNLRLLLDQFRMLVLLKDVMCVCVLHSYRHCCVTQKVETH